MIIVKTPLRITLGGGGTDIPEYYEKYQSTFISAAIDKYVVITFYKTSFFPYIHLKYSRTETVQKLDDIKHEIIRETLRFHNIQDHVEIVSHADIPSGTGLGSSGSFGVGLEHAISSFTSKNHLAERAYNIQREILHHPIGKQDQYAAAFGGINVYKIQKDGFVEIKRLNTDYEELNNKLVLFFTGLSRNSNEVLSDQTLEGFHVIKELAIASQYALEKNDFREFGELMNEHWEQKKKRSRLISNPQIDTFYNLALKNGAQGGKIVGAGGGGFFLFVTEDREKLIKAMPLLYVPFKFDFEGSRILFQE